MKRRTHRSPRNAGPRKCTARSARSGKPCNRSAIVGGTVCPTHGGKAPQVIAKANQRIADLIDPDRALREAAYIAYMDPRQVFDSVTGRLLPVSSWPDTIAAAVGGIDVVKRNLNTSDGLTDDVVKLKFWDKVHALEMLFKHMKLFEDRTHVDGEIVMRWQD